MVSQLSLCSGSTIDMDQTEAEDLKKSWQEYTEQLYRKDLNYPNNQDGVITLGPDNLECEVKWVLGSITMMLHYEEAKLLQILLMMLWKCCTQHASKFGKLSSGHNWKRSVFIPIPKKDKDKGCLNYCTIALISHTSKVMLQILQSRLLQYVNWELPDVQAGFGKGTGTRDQIGSIHWIIEKAKGFHKNIYCFIDYTKAFDCVEHNKLWEILKEMGIPVHLTCLLKNLYAGQEATIRTGHGTTDWFQIGKGVRQGCILTCCLSNFYAEYIMQNAGLDEAQAGIKIAGRNINNLSYADDTILMAESEEEPEALDKGERGKWKSWPKTQPQHSKNEDHGILSNHFMENRWGNNGNSDRFNFLGL